MDAEKGERAEEGEMTLVFETDEVIVLRRIQSPRILPPDAEVGPGTEHLTRGVAATYGLPDFVFRSKVYSSGSRNREVGDAVVIAGRFGAAIQVKARETPSSEPKREESWLNQGIKKGLRQATGTIRRLSGSAHTLINERGREVEIDGQSMSWVPVVVLDHPNPPRDYTPWSLVDRLGVVILRRDWEFLFEQLKSTHAVVQYLHRIGDTEPVRLGTEPARYYELAAVDAAAQPTPQEPWLAELGGDPWSSPLLPMTPAGSGDEAHHKLLRMIMEDLAIAPRPQEVEEAQLLEVLAALDTLPIAMRSDIGGLLMEWLENVTTFKSQGVKWQLRRVISPAGPHLIFAAATLWTLDVQTAFSILVQLRHQQLVEVSDRADDLTSIGILLTPRYDGVRQWDTTMIRVRGELHLELEERRDMEFLWPLPPS